MTFSSVLHARPFSRKPSSAHSAQSAQRAIDAPFGRERNSVYNAIGARHFELFVAAVEVVVETQAFSILILKLALGIGAHRARIVARQLEAQGVISKRSGMDAREVLIANDDLALLLLVLRS